MEDDIGLEEDPIVRIFDVVVSSQYEEKPYLFQYPLRLPDAPYSCRRDESILSARIKPRNGVVEVDIPLHENLNNFSDVGKLTDDSISMKLQTLRGKMAEEDAQYMVGILHETSLHLVPIEGSVFLRPKFSHLVSNTEQSMPTQTCSTEARALTISIKKEDTIHQDAISKAMRDMEDEQWTDLTWQELNSNISQEIVDKLTSSSILHKYATSSLPTTYLNDISAHREK